MTAQFNKRVLISAFLYFSLFRSHCYASTTDEGKDLFREAKARMAMHTFVHLHVQIPTNDRLRVLSDRYLYREPGKVFLAKTVNSVYSQDGQLLRQSTLIQDSEGVWRLIPSAKLALKFPGKPDITSNDAINAELTDFLEYKINSNHVPSPVTGDICTEIEIRLSTDQISRLPPKIRGSIDGPYSARILISNSSREIAGFITYGPAGEKLAEEYYSISNEPEPPQADLFKIPVGYSLYFATSNSEYWKILTHFDSQEAQKRNEKK
jgi:hypothetical protein